MVFNIGDYVRHKKNKHKGQITKVIPVASPGGVLFDYVITWEFDGSTTTVPEWKMKADWELSPSKQSSIILPAGADWVPDLEEPAKCTCGISAIGGGLHSDWCDLKG